MARAPLRRTFGLFAAVLLLYCTSADALGLHRCAHHDALPGQTGQAGGHAHHHGQDSAPPEQDGGCTCVGTCSMGSAAISVAPHAVVFATTPPTLVAAAETPGFVPPAAPDFLLPFGTAPPAAL